MATRFSPSTSHFCTISHQREEANVVVDQIMDPTWRLHTSVFFCSFCPQNLNTQHVTKRPLLFQHRYHRRQFIFPEHHFSVDIN
jgi:hypothetical protein